MSEAQSQETEDPKGLEVFISSIDSTNKPWFLTSTIVYDAVKKTVASIPHSEALFDKCIHGIGALTAFINQKTGLKVVIVDREKANDLIAKLDGILADQFIRVDDGFDILRSKLATSLRKLIESLVNQKKLAFATGNKFIARAESARDTTTRSLTTRFERAVEVLKNIIDNVKARCPPQVTEFVEKIYTTTEHKSHEILATAQATSNSWLDGIYAAADTRFTLASAYLLKTAQPYIHNAVTRGQPYLANAVEVSQPYVVQAKPYFDPLVVRANEVKQRLEDHKLVGPYVARAYATANKTMADVKVYCLSESQGEEVFTQLDEEVEEVKADDINDADADGATFKPIDAVPVPAVATHASSSGNKKKTQGQGRPSPAPQRIQAASSTSSSAAAPVAPVEA